MAKKKVNLLGLSALIHKDLIVTDDLNLSKAQADLKSQLTDPQDIRAENTK
jgi:hypothetical protein